MYARLGWFCGGGMLLLWGASVPLQCWGKASLVGGTMFFAGVLFGTSLAAITRTRRPALIYLWLFVALGTLWPLMLGWPFAYQDEVHPWRGAPSIVLNYFDVLRFGAYLLGFPYPFAAWGYHAPDPPPSPPQDLSP